MKKVIKSFLSSAPVIDGLFRRFVWSHIHFPEYEMKFLDDLPKGVYDVAIDVGAAIGSYSWILDRKFKSVLAFEPGDDHYNYLRRLLFGTNIDLRKKAVGQDTRQIEFYTPGEDTEAFHSATASTNNPISQQEDVFVKSIEQVSLDAIWRSVFGSDRTLDLLKIDIEGYEMEAFKGVKELISTHYPIIICEIEVRHNSAYQDVFRLLYDMGYNCYFWRDMKFNELNGCDIEGLQLSSDLEIRLGDDFNPNNIVYINNFVFQHFQSKIKVNQ